MCIIGMQKDHIRTLKMKKGYEARGSIICVCFLTPRKLQQTCRFTQLGARFISDFHGEKIDVQLEVGGRDLILH